MKHLESTALRSDGSRLWILDQTLLPAQEAWLEAGRPEAMIQHIQRSLAEMNIRSRIYILRDAFCYCSIILNVDIFIHHDHEFIEHHLSCPPQ